METGDPELEAEFVESLRDAIRGQDGGSQFDLAEVTSFDWSVAHVFRPYASKEAVNEALGSRIDSRDIDMFDSFNLMVFAGHGGVVLTVEVPLGVCDFEHPHEPNRHFRVANTSALFQVAIDEGGYCLAKPVNGIQYDE